MKIDREDIESFREWVDDHLDEVITTLQQYKDLCLEDESLALRSEKFITLLESACTSLDMASMEIVEVGIDLFGENNAE